jgi:putative membrane protein
MRKISTSVIAFVLLVFMAGCGPTSDKGSTDTDNSKGEGAIDSTRQARFDTSQSTSSVPNFITASIKSNIGEIKLLQLAQSRATSPEVKQLAKQAMVDSLENDVTRAAFQKLSSVQGKAFEDQWREQMLQLHENNSDELRTMQSITTDAEVKQWLDKTIPVVEQHRDLLAKKDMKQPNLQKGQTRD